MTARDDYPILMAWLGGMEMTGFNGDAMEIEVARAFEEIDRLRDLLGPPMTGAELRAAVMSRRTASDAIGNEHPTNRSTT